MNRTAISIAALLTVALATSWPSSLHAQGGVTPGSAKCKGSVSGYPFEYYPGLGEEWLNVVLNCEPQCTAGCISVSVPTGPSSEAYVCSCRNGNPNPCCTVGLNTETFFVVPVGDCSAFLCPDDTECHVISSSNWENPWTGRGECHSEGQ